MLYKRYIKNHFFNKILMVYILITLVFCGILFITLSENLVSIKSEEALVVSDQILNIVDSFMKDKLENARDVHQKLLRNKNTWRMIEEELSDGDTTAFWNNLQSEREAMMHNVYAIDGEFYGMFFFNHETGKSIRLGNLENIQVSHFIKMAAESEEKKEGAIRIYSGRREENKSNAFPIFLFRKINDSEDFTYQIGTMGLCFSARNIKQKYREFDKYRKGEIYILDGDGNLLFDSSEEYETQRPIPFEKIQGIKEGEVRSGNYIYNSIYNPKAGYYVLNILPVSMINKEVHVLQENILKVMFLILAAAFILNFLSTKIFSKRIQAIIDVMKQVEKGQLTDFKTKKQYEDEVGFIHTELIKMCQMLKEYIDKEYVYRLHQKEMELYALQAQINPHFLYNSLEAIRMNLYMKGEEEASKMIRILSDLFRNIMKKDVVVTNRDEIHYLESYLELYQFRLGERMSYTIDIPDEIYRYATIKHILQPIIENALVHGIEQKGLGEKTSHLLVSARKEGDDIYFIVQDEGVGISEEQLKEIQEKLDSQEVFQNSIGIYNVNSRLRIVYGDEYRLTIRSRENQGTEVILRMKAMKKRELESYVQNTYSG